MRWIDKLERRYGRYGIPNLMNIILIGQLIVWFFIMFINSDLMYLLSLTRYGLQRFQLWRVVTFVFMPTLTTSPFWLLVELYFYWWIGNSLERAWGDFRFTVYLVAEMLGAVLSCLLVGAAGNGAIFLSMFFAYAWMWPEQQVRLFFILPVKIKWLGWASALVWLVQFLMGGLTAKLSLVFGLAGFLLFFGQEIWVFCRDAAVNYKRRKDWERRYKK